jgi:DNA-binding NarL/FixJ family response regulator
MKSSSIVLLQVDPVIAQSLTASLLSSFRSVHAVRSMQELRSSILKHRAKVVILDIEMASLPEVERLSHEFPGLSVVCTHRLADEEMWTAALSAGASDICPTYDTHSILTAAVRNARRAQSAAA